MSAPSARVAPARGSVLDLGTGVVHADVGRRIPRERRLALDRGANVGYRFVEVILPIDARRPIERDEVMLPVR